VRGGFAVDDREHRVRVGLLGQLDARRAAHRVRQPPGHRVRVCGELAPQVRPEQDLELRGQEAHLRRELHRLLAQVEQLAGVVRPEHHDGLADHQPVLGSAEGDRVDVAVGRERRERHVECRRGIGEPRPVDVHEQVALVRGVGDRAHLVGRVDRAELGRVRQGHDARLNGVLVAHAVDPRRDVLGPQLPVGRVDGEQLDARHRLGSAALVDLEVGGRGTDHALPRAAQRAQRHDVRTGPVEDEEGVRFVAEVLPEAALDGGGGIVVPVRRRVPVVGGGQRREHVGVHAGVVVAAEAAPHG
jgi:hypothetical protein